MCVSTEQKLIHGSLTLDRELKNQDTHRKIKISTKTVIICRKEVTISTIASTAAWTDPGFVVVMGISVDWTCTCSSVEVCVELLSPKGAH